MKHTAIIKSGKGIYYSAPADFKNGPWEGSLVQSGSIYEAKQNYKRNVQSGEPNSEFEFLYDLSSLRNFFDVVNLEFFSSVARISVPKMRDLIAGDRYASNGERLRILHTFQKIGILLSEARY